MKRRKFEVSGRDDQGDLHVFCTDDREQAEAMRLQMIEDLEDVQLSEGD